MKRLAKLVPPVPSTRAAAGLRRRAEAELAESAAQPESSPAMRELHLRAQARLRQRRKQQPAKSEAMKSATAEPERLLHELEVHQVELELQNAELQEARDRMETLLENYTDLYDFAPVGYFTLAADGAIQQVNLTGAHLVGIERSRLVGQSFGLLVVPALRPAFQAFLQLVFAGQERHSGDFEFLSRGQPARTVSVKAQRLLSGQQCRAVVVDITERTQATDKVRVSEVRFRRLFEAAHDGVLLLDPGTRKITDANPFMTKLLGYPHAQLVGKELFEIGLLKDEAASQAMFRKLKKSHEVRYEDLPLESREGRHQEVEVVANLYQEDGHSVIQCNIRDITERKLAERELSERARLLDLSHDAIIVRDLEGRIRYWNHGAEELYGWSREEALGKISNVLLQTEYPTSLKQMIEELHRTERWIGELVHVDRAGRRLTVFARKALDRDRHGNPASVLENLTDITDRKQAEDKVRVSEVRFRRLFETAHDGVLLLDPGTRKITDANPFMTKLLGYPHAQLVGKELFEIGLLKDEDASQQMFRKLKRQHEVRYEDLPLESREGRHQEVEVVANLYQEAGHSVIQCNIRDITERKQAEEALRRNESLFSTLVARAPVGVYVVNARFQLQQANPRARRVFRKVHPLIGRDFSEVIHAVWPRRVADQVVARFRRTLTTGLPYQSSDFAERRRDLGVKEYYEWQIRRVTLPAGEHGVVCFFNDVTERKQAEEAQRRLAVLTASNVKLEREIVRRRTVQDTLRQSEQHQRQLLAQAHLMQEQLRQLSRQVLRAQEEERKRISRELHDVVAQTLAGINVRLASLKSEAGLDPGGFARNLAQTQRMVERSVEVVHRFARELRPAVLDDLGLIPALHSLMKVFTERTGVHTRLTAFAAVEKLDGASRTVLYRVAQEALSNVAKHARASRVEVHLQKTRGAARMEIVDDGRSFGVERVLNSKGNKRLGLLGMRERLEMVGGGFAVKSAPGKGTTITAWVPFGRKTRGGGD